MPYLPKTICPKCGFIKEGNEKCPRCSKEYNKSYNVFQRDNEVHDSVYNQTRWRELREMALKRSKGLCEMCFKENKIEKADVVDHIKELSDGGEPFDINNLQSLCVRHHNKKSAEEKKRREKNAKNKSNYRS